MTNIYLIRHAEAAGNTKRLFQGHYDGEVGENGKKQLVYLKERFAGIALDAIYASPLSRAVQTARAVCGDRDLPIRQREDIIEINGGGFEGKPFEELYKLYPEEMDNWDHKPWAFVAPEGGESILHVHERMCAAIEDIARQNEGKTVAVVSHGCAIRSYICRPMGLGLQRLNEVPWCNNTGVSLLHFDGGFNARLEYFGDISHLPEECCQLARTKWWDFSHKEKEEPAGKGVLASAGSNA